MTDRTNGGSPVTHPQPFHTVPTTVIAEAERRDRYPKQSELKALSAFFSTGRQRLEIAAVLAQQADVIVAAGANRIFSGGSPMAYLEPPAVAVGLPGSGYYVGEDFLSARARHRHRQSKAQTKLQEPAVIDANIGLLDRVKTLFAAGRPSPPSRFRTIDISQYGTARMKRSLRDLAWFLRYVSYAIVAGDTSILSVNVRGLRGVIPEDVTLATVVALQEMQWRAGLCFPQDAAAAALVKRYFEVLITDYLVEKPQDQLRFGVSKLHPGLPLPQSYADSALPVPKLAMKPAMAETEVQEVVRAAYRQVFERDIAALYGPALAPLESQLRSGQLSLKEFVRQLGKSRLYRREFYEPFSISRVVELACRHFLGRGLSCREEFQTYFEVISEGGLPALVDALVDTAEYADYFGEETVPYLRGLGQEAQECRNWGPQFDLFRYSAIARKAPQFITTFARAQKPLPNQHPYGVGNDPLEIQFGAIFPNEQRHPVAQPAHFSTSSRRLLISCDRHAGLAANSAAHFGSGLGQAAFKLEPSHQPQGHQEQEPNLNVTHHSIEAVILATYRQLFGRDVLASQRQAIAETQLKGGQISLRDFVRQLAKSRPFRQQFWESLYITKSIEYIHRRLLGRPTYGREELNRYYNIAAKQGFYALIDALIDSPEYAQAFGYGGVPYERYLTPRGYSLRLPQGPVAWWKGRENPDIAGAWMQSAASTFSPDQSRQLAAVGANRQASAADQLAQSGQSGHRDRRDHNGGAGAIATAPADTAPADTAAADPQPAEANSP